jgi:hypothetical protein
MFNAHDTSITIGRIMHDSSKADFIELEDYGAMTEP